VALTAARVATCTRHGWDVRELGLQPSEGRKTAPQLTVYKSAEGHGCHQKAVEILGIGSRNLCEIPTDEALRIDPSALDALLTRDRAAGKIPMAVIATAGTVNTGAIDPLRDIASVCARHHVWLHIDGAYGAPAILTSEYSEVLSSLALADSVAMDPHKWLYVPVDAGFVAIRDAENLRSSFSLVPPYLRTDGDENGVQGPPWFSEFGIEQTRPFRALKVWMALKTFGTDGYRSLIEHDIRMARSLASELREQPAFEVWQPQEMSIVCFRARPAMPQSSRSDLAADALNRALLRAMQLGGQAFLSGTVLRNRVWLRACIVNPRTGPGDVSMLVHEATLTLASLQQEKSRERSSPLS
jgi:aromatic-L-amino-acid decarboxylase